MNINRTGAINLTNRSRIQHPNGKLVNHISTDISRIDFAAGMFHMVWTAPSKSSLVEFWFVAGSLR